MKPIGSIIADIIGDIEPPEINLTADELAKADIFDYPIAVFVDEARRAFHDLEHDYHAVFDEPPGNPITGKMLTGRLGDGRRFRIILNATHPRGIIGLHGRQFSGSIDLTVNRLVHPDVSNAFLARLIAVNT